MAPESGSRAKPVDVRHAMKTVSTEPLTMQTTQVTQSVWLCELWSWTWCRDNLKFTLSSYLEKIGPFVIHLECQNSEAPMFAVLILQFSPPIWGA
jgi:hypothetical protein